MCLLPLENGISGQTMSLGTCLFSGGVPQSAVFPSSQVGSTNSAVPSAPAYNSHEFWSSLSPAGLSDVVKQLCDALQPHLNSRWVRIPSSKPRESWDRAPQSLGELPLCYRASALSGAGSILLSGPSGSGKLMAVRAVCSCLNLHLFKVIPSAVC